MTEPDAPHPPAVVEAVTPPEGTARRVLPTMQELAELDELDDDEKILSLPRDKRDLLLLRRTKRSESASVDATNKVDALGATLGASVDKLTKEMAAKNEQDAKRDKKAAEHGDKIEWLLRRVALGGGLGGGALIALKLVDILLR